MCTESPNGQAESFTQACETARHYGNMRFAFATFFTAILGALLSAEWHASAKLSEQGLLDNFRWVAAALAISFAVGEWRLARLIHFYHHDAFHKHGGRKLAEPSFNGVWGFIVPLIVSAPALVCFAFWVWCAVQRGNDQVLGPLKGAG